MHVLLPLWLVQRVTSTNGYLVMTDMRLRSHHIVHNPFPTHQHSVNMVCTFYTPKPVWFQTAARKIPCQPMHLYSVSALLPSLFSLCTAWFKKNVLCVCVRPSELLSYSIQCPVSSRYSVIFCKCASAKHSLFETFQKLFNPFSAVLSRPFPPWRGRGVWHVYRMP